LYKNIFITATNTDIGKTYTNTMLIKHLAKKGLRVGIYKPIETGVDTTPLDGSLLYNEVCKVNSDFKKLFIDDIVTYQFKLPASVYVAKECEIDLKLIKEHIKYLKNYCDILLIEGAGGLMVPIERDFFMVDFIEYLDAKALLVTSSKLGSINDTLLSIDKLKSHSIDYEWVINLHKDIDSFDRVTLPFYNDYFKDIYFVQKNLDSLIDNFILA
jgi:dethiobiotin synthetase